MHLELALSDLRGQSLVSFDHDVEAAIGHAPDGCRLVEQQVEKIDYDLRLLQQADARRLHLRRGRGRGEAWRA